MNGSVSEVSEGKEIVEPYLNCVASSSQPSNIAHAVLFSAITLSVNGAELVVENGMQLWPDL